MFIDSFACRGIQVVGVFDGCIAMSVHALNCPPNISGKTKRSKTRYRARVDPSAVQLSSILVKTDDSGILLESKKISCSATALTRCQNSNLLLGQSDTIGIIGGVSVYSTLIFLEKLVWLSSRDGGECLPFVVCSDPTMKIELSRDGVRSSSHREEGALFKVKTSSLIVENLRKKRAFLEQSGARCIVMPCHLSHAWYSEASQDCSLPFLHVGECIARELKEAKLKPLEAGSNVRIGVLSTDAILKAGFYQEKLQNQGFEVVLPDERNMEHIVVPALEALHRKDMEGARNLLRIAIQVLLVRAVSTVILASDNFQGLLPWDDPLLKRCVDPMDALARSTINWAYSTEEKRAIS